MDMRSALGLAVTTWPAGRANHTIWVPRLQILSSLMSKPSGVDLGSWIVTAHPRQGYQLLDSHTAALSAPGSH